MLGVIPMTLAAVVRYCAPAVAPQTALAIIKIESDGRPFAIDDDTAHRSYFPQDRQAAVRMASRLLAQGHTLDVGLMQVDSIYFRSDAASLERIFDPCVNVSTGSSILVRAYRWSAQVYGPGKVALYHAFEAYNSGKLDAAPSYADAVWQAGLSL